MEVNDLAGRESSLLANKRRWGTLWCQLKKAKAEKREGDRWSSMSRKYDLKLNQPTKKNPTLKTQGI